MNHSVQESPKQDVGKKTSDKASSEEQAPGFKALIPSATSLKDEQQREKERCEEVEDETI